MPHLEYIRSTNVTEQEIQQKIGAAIRDFTITEEEPGIFLIEVKPEIEERRARMLIEGAFHLLAKEEEE